MPKVIIYVRADDARNIEAVTGKDVAEWCRATMATAIELWKQVQAERREAS
jgi:DNA-binding ferritin-like protein (Dps family)